MFTLTRLSAVSPELPSKLPLLVCFSFSSNSRWRRRARKGPYTLHPFSQQSPQGCPRSSANICLVKHSSFSTLEGGISFLHSSFLQAISAAMLWPVHVQKVSQASEHLCPAKLQTRCDICYDCQSIYPFIPTDSDVSRTVDPRSLCSLILCMAVCQSGQPIPDSTFCRRFIESVRMCQSVGLGPVSWRPTTVKCRQFSQSNRHSTIGTRQTEYHEALPSSVNVQSHLTSSFVDDGHAS